MKNFFNNPIVKNFFNNPIVLGFTGANFVSEEKMKISVGALSPPCGDDADRAGDIFPLPVRKLGRDGSISSRPFFAWGAYGGLIECSNPERVETWDERE